MPTHMTININELLTEIRRLSKTNQNLKLFAWLGAGYAAYLYMDNKKLKEKNKALATEIEEMKTTKGE